MRFGNDVFHFGEISIGRSGVISADDASLISVSTVMETLMAPARSAAVMALYDGICGMPRYASPSTSDLPTALRAIERALRSGDWVARREVRRGAPYSPPAIDVELLTEAAPAPSPSPTPTTTFEATFVDASGTPFDGLPVVWSLGGKTRKATTDASGTTRFDDDQGRTFASLTLANVDAVRDELRSRDIDPKAAPLPGSSAYDVSADVSDFSVPCETPTTLVLTLPVETWVGIELVDAEGAPLAGQPYRITTDQGDVFEGVLDGDGKARVAVSQSVTWTVVFPGLDESIFASGSPS